MDKKVCFKCGVEKPLSEFYKHSRMADGHVNKCKECNLEDVKGNYKDNVKKPGYIWSYNDSHVLEVIELTKKHHMKAHRFLVYDQERMMYRRYDTNELLDTKEKHEQFILWCIDSKED